MSPVSRTIRRAADLVERGLASPDQEAVLREVAARFSVAISQPVVALIHRTGRDGPIARQYVPSPDEMTVSASELADPIGDHVHSPVKGIVHRYPDRVLLKLVHVCPVYCRFCFRRESVGTGGEVLTPVEIDHALQYISEHTELWEVILSGGDPLVMADRKLAAIVAALDAMAHIKVIRIHTRYPVAEPTRITDDMLRSLRSRAAMYMVIHCNHAAELTADAVGACRRIASAGVSLLSQSVLLAGVNDSDSTLEQLMRALVATGIKPYYLHHLDLAQGTGHFRVSIRNGQRLVRHLRGRLSGLCQPIYVLDIPGGHGKALLSESCVEHFDESSACYTVRDYKGQSHLYRDDAE